MILKMYTDSLLNNLKTNHMQNIDKYNSNEVFVTSLIGNYEVELYNLGMEVDYPQLDCRLADKDSGIQQWEIDYNNSIILHRDFIQKYDISVGILSDERFIAYLTHDIYYKYMRTRWPVNNNENRLLQKYFLPSGSFAFTRNMFLRLFWYSLITYNPSLENPYELTRVAFEYADPVNQIMERKYGRNKKMVQAALTAIKNLRAKELNVKRTIFGKTINNMLSMYALDVLPMPELVKVFENEIAHITSSDIEDTSPVVEE